MSHLSRGSSGIAPLYLWLVKSSNTEDMNALLSWLWGVHPGAALGLRHPIVQVYGPLAPSVPATAPDALSAALMHATSAARYLLALAGAPPLALSSADPLLDPPTVRGALSAFAICGSERELVAFLRNSTPRQLLGVLECLARLYPPAAKAILGARTRAVAPGLKALVVTHWPAASRGGWGLPHDTPQNVPCTVQDLADIARDLQAMALPEPVLHALRRLSGCPLGADETACLMAIDDMPDPILEGVLDALSLAGNEEAVRRLAALALQAHPEGGWYRETFRSPHGVQAGDGRPARSALTTIDFLLAPGQFSAWHRVASDEVWHLLEGGPLRLWLMPPSLDALTGVTLGPVGPGQAPRHAVPAHWWQAAEPLAAGHALCGATVGPGFDFADFSFLRDDAPALAALRRLRPDLARLASPRPA